MAIHNPIVFALGAAALVLGFVLWRWAGRNSVDLKGAALSSAMSAARGGKIPDVPQDLKDQYNKLSAAGSHGERAKMVSGTVARHMMAKVVRMGGLAAFVAGFVLMAAGVFWK